MIGFDEALQFVLAREGGYVNHPADKGGATNQGVTQATYNAFLTRRNRPIRSVRNIAPDEVRDIYFHIWKQAGCQFYLGPLGLCVFDFAVNSGVSRAVRFLQKALWLEEDGIPGPETYKAAMSSESEMISWTLLTLRREYFRQIAKGGQEVFLKGWLNRIEELRKVIFGPEADEGPETRSA